MLLDVVLEAHAWALSHPKHEGQVVVPKFEKKISQVTEVEKEQGTSPRTLASLLSVIFDKVVHRGRVLFITEQTWNKRENDSTNSSVV
ncbi:hypothetical protein ARMSODRAFT_955579 [Armillaria solidipes]|uniref:Uncharacterized protein n=1 Tax=Armillaria solidipes TaxID=1076256 RepID=A0A2H3C6A5_9AGAR|nr:hypothetical protein ARMSODRAFT_955579 [Armillaria solidipes]